MHVQPDNVTSFHGLVAHKEKLRDTSISLLQQDECLNSNHLLLPWICVFERAGSAPQYEHLKFAP